MKETKNTAPEERIKRAAELNVLGRDLTRLALEKKLGPIYKRTDLIKRVEIALTLGQNPLLVGKPGVGKNAVVEGLVSEMVEKNHSEYRACYDPSITERPPVKVIYECQPMAFQVDCFYAHEFETKLNAIVENCKLENAILFIDNIHLAIFAGAVSGHEERTIANLLRPHLEKKVLTVIGATTPEGYNFILNNNPSFASCFVKIDVLETSPEETAMILFNLKTNFEEVYRIKIEDELLKQVIEITARLFPQRSFPGKALEAIKEIIANEKMKNNDHLTPSTIYSYIAMKTGLADFIVSPEKKITREAIVEFFKKRIFDQDPIIEAICDTIMRFKSGLNAANRPIDVLLFIGPSGVGKTELAKVLSEYLFGSQTKLIRFDMSEYIGEIGYEKLIGSRFRAEPGLLISAAIANPFAVYLFDEIEKADRRIFDVFLQAFGEGRITDPKGQTANLTNSIIIMTSNIGSDLYKKTMLGFTSALSEEIRNIEKKITDSLKEYFRPEFINRINNILYFQPLSQEGIRKIAYKEITSLLERIGLKAGNYRLVVDEKVLELLTKIGYTPEYGARPMQRAVEKIVVNPLAELLASKVIPAGAILKVKLDQKNSPTVEVSLS